MVEKKEEEGRGGEGRGKHSTIMVPCCVTSLFIVPGGASRSSRSRRGRRGGSGSIECNRCSERCEELTSRTEWPPVEGEQVERRRGRDRGRAEKTTGEKKWEEIHFPPGRSPFPAFRPHSKRATFSKWRRRRCSSCSSSRRTERGIVGSRCKQCRERERIECRRRRRRRREEEGEAG